jgi:hypothetical protein
MPRSARPLPILAWTSPGLKSFDAALRVPRHLRQPICASRSVDTTYGFCILDPLQARISSRLRASGTAMERSNA